MRDEQDIDRIRAGGSMENEHNGRTVRIVRESLCAIFAQVDDWFDRAPEFRGFRPSNGVWTADQVLEHITLTNRFLMLTLEKFVRIAERRAARGVPVSSGESDLARIEVIGERGSFGWIRPEHMEPVGRPPDEVRALLHEQLGTCLILLERMRHGIGSLCQIRMTVNDLGRIDLYQWLYFLAQHARRHLQQLESIESEFLKQTGG
ncbi:MAG TPA: DinB family protein [Planctomycetaceae bacterium]|nr:DinB family protein [Planctomycetaceae bacterium]